MPMWDSHRRKMRASLIMRTSRTSLSRRSKRSSCREYPADTVSWLFAVLGCVEVPSTNEDEVAVQVLVAVLYSLQCATCNVRCDFGMAGGSKRKPAIGCYIADTALHWNCIILL